MKGVYNSDIWGGCLLDRVDSNEKHEYDVWFYSLKWGHLCIKNTWLCAKYILFIKFQLLKWVHLSNRDLWLTSIHQQSDRLIKSTIGLIHMDSGISHILNKTVNRLTKWKSDI